MANNFAVKRANQTNTANNNNTTTPQAPPKKPEGTFVNGGEKAAGDTFERTAKTAETPAATQAADAGKTTYENYKKGTDSNDSQPRNLTGAENPTPKDVNQAHKQFAKDQHSDYLNRFDGDKNGKLSAGEFTKAKVSELSAGKNLSPEAQKKLEGTASRIGDALKDKDGNITEEGLAKLNTLLDQYVDAVPDGKFTKDDEQKTYDFLGDKKDDIKSNLDAAGKTLDLLPNLTSLNPFIEDAKNKTTDPKTGEQKVTTPMDKALESQNPLDLFTGMGYTLKDKDSKAITSKHNDLKSGKITQEAYDKFIQKMIMKLDD